MAKWFWDRPATLIGHKVTYEERMAQKRQRLEKTGLGVVARAAAVELAVKPSVSQLSTLPEQNRVSQPVSPLSQYAHRTSTCMD